MNGQIIGLMVMSIYKTLPQNIGYCLFLSLVDSQLLKVRLYCYSCRCPQRMKNYNKSPSHKAFLGKLTLSSMSIDFSCLSPCLMNTDCIRLQFLPYGLFIPNHINKFCLGTLSSIASTLTFLGQTSWSLTFFLCLDHKYYSQV